jgi:hypothetical protein
MKLLRGLSLLVEVPLALASLLLYVLVRWTLRRVANRHYSRQKEQARRWRPLSADTLRKLLALPVLMTSAPRWNPHAVIATLGPLSVRETLTVDVEAARRSAEVWSIVVYTFPGFRTVASIDSLDACPGSTRSVSLKPGRYWIGLRYYCWKGDVVLPGVAVDGSPAVEAMPLPGDVNAFYRELPGRRSWFYLALHYHVWLLLRLKAWLPRSLVASLFLPVGNPGTVFLYGALRRGERLVVEASEETLRQADVYLTFYDRASFPVAWEAVSRTRHETVPVPAPRTYLLRTQPRVAGARTDATAAETGA